jgi:hypothetical protein
VNVVSRERCLKSYESQKDHFADDQICWNDLNRELNLNPSEATTLSQFCLEALAVTIKAITASRRNTEGESLMINDLPFETDAFRIRTYAAAPVLYVTGISKESTLQDDSQILEMQVKVEEEEDQQRPNQADVESEIAESKRRWRQTMGIQ